MAGLTLRGIVKRYGNQAPTLKGIDLDIRDGEFLVLVGPSGCGKSTLLRTIAGLESITDGTLDIGDRRVNDVHPKDRDIAMVFQSYALYPHMTNRRNMAFGLEVRKMPKDEIDRRVNEASKMLGLDEHLDKLPKMLSGGQRQRVAIGRAIVRDPSVFLFDEPLSNLDAHLRNEMRVEIRRLHKKMKTTIIYVTHDQVEAMTLADRIAVLNGGYLQQVGSPLELFQRTDNKFVAGFIGSPAMNFINAEIKEENGNLRKEENGKMRVIIDEANSIVLNEEMAKSVKDGQKVILGLRPQDVVLAEGDKSGDLTVTVDVVETLGWESHVHFKLGDLHFLAVLEADKVKNYKDGESVKLHVPMSAIHLFDVETEKAIAHGTKSDDEIQKAAKLDKADDAKADDAKADAPDEAKAEEPADKGE
ncbi:MAG: sn-glycerol-3-phosphate ABC transporter ATP-binding protein UgpC [Proteobacteria bacterium]|nr:sn-glycerol-3-phosphate ABC transporter ATP-binding protein UgpC [Pseudomonadota bacterium]